MNARRGKTLVEMLILITIIGTTTGIGATTLVGLFKTERQVRRDIQQQTTLARLASRFRTDVHSARSCQVQQSCDLSLNDGRIVRYAAAGSRLTREVLRADAVEHRDAFLLPDTALIRFEQPEATGGRLVRLTISAAESSDKAYLTSVRPTVIEAAIGISATRAEAKP